MSGPIFSNYMSAFVVPCHSIETSSLSFVEFRKLNTVYYKPGSFRFKAPLFCRGSQIPFACHNITQSPEAQRTFARHLTNRELKETNTASS